MEHEDRLKTRLFLPQDITFASDGTEQDALAEYLEGERHGT